MDRKEVILRHAAGMLYSKSDEFRETPEVDNPELSL